MSQPSNIAMAENAEAEAREAGYRRKLAKALKERDAYREMHVEALAGLNKVKQQLAALQGEL